MQVRLDGRPIGELPAEFQGDPKYDPRYTQQYSELLGTAFALGVVGCTDVDLQRIQDAADFSARDEAGNLFYIEFSTIAKSSSRQYENALTDYNAHLARLIDENEQVRRNLDNVFAEVVIPELPAKSERYEFLEELSRLAETEDLHTEKLMSRNLSTNYALLNRLGAQIVVAPSRSNISHFSLRPPARSVSPYELVNLTTSTLQKKRRAMEQSALRPVWLILYFSDLSAIYDTNLEMLESLAPESIRPFSRVLIGDQRAMIEYCATESAAGASRAR